MIGAGIFSILGLAGEIAGGAMYISFDVAGIVALLCAYSYAKLGARYPSAGGAVEFLVRGFGTGPISGALNVLLLFGYIFALALYARAFGTYAATFLGPDAPSVWTNVFATGVIAAFTGLNFIGARAVGRAEVAIVAVKVAVLIAFAAVGLALAKPGAFATSTWASPRQILFAAGVVFLGYEGFGLITNAADDMQNPSALLPRALYTSVAVVIGVYVLVALAVLGNLSVAEIAAAKDYALAQAASPSLGAIGFKIMAGAALFSTASAINATLYGGANASYVIAKHGELPAFFDRKLWHNTQEGLFIVAATVLVVANLFQLDGIAMLGSASFLLVYGTVNVGHIRIARETGARRPMLVAASLACALSLALLLTYAARTSPATILALGVVVAASFGIEIGYRAVSRRTMTTLSANP